MSAKYRIPHTARFLQTFHTAFSPEEIDEDNIYGEDAYALSLEAAQDDDLLNLVDDTVTPDVRTAGQIKFMDDLIGRLAALDAEIGRQAREYTDGMTEHGRWTAGRKGNASDWIGRMIDKERALKAATPVTSTPPQVADGRYAVEEDGALRFFHVKNGHRPGFVFLDVQSSDDLHPIRNVTRIRSVLALIAEDPKAATVRYGRELGICGRCGRTLTDEASRSAGIGPRCASK